MQRAGSVVTDDYLLHRLGAAAWSGRGNRDTLCDHLEALRRKIEPDPGQPVYIREVPSGGTCFAQ
jgi:DNA-binding response OmpR family regulator